MKRTINFDSLLFSILLGTLPHQNGNRYPLIIEDHEPYRVKMGTVKMGKRYGKGRLRGKKRDGELNGKRFGTDTIR